MKIAPRYDGEPIVSLDGPADAAGGPLVRQRRRLAGIAAGLSTEEWAASSRCEGWRVQDVVAHLTGTNQFFTASISAGLAGAPTRMLAGFDPKATPAALVDAVRDASPEDTLAAFVDSTEKLCATVESLDGPGWEARAESPAGHVSVNAVVHHAFWDGWVHERDILVPLGLEQDLEDDELRCGVRYAAAVGPALAIQSGAARTGVLALRAEHPATRVVVTVGDTVRVTEGEAPPGALVLAGDAVDLLEALSVRVSWGQPIPDEHRWLVTGLADVFEVRAAR